MIDEKERIKMSFGFAGDVVKQLIALSTAIITICVALTDKLFSSEAAKDHFMWLLVALVLFVLSILTGLLTMMAITGTLGKRENQQPAPVARSGLVHETGGDNQGQNNENFVNEDVNKGTIYQKNITSLMCCQLFTFFFAIILSVVFLFTSACSQPKADKEPTNIEEKIENGIKIQVTSNFTVLDSTRVDTISVEVK